MANIIRLFLTVIVLVILIPIAAAHAQSPQGGNSYVPSADDVVLRPGDVLRISVWPDNGLGGDFTVEETGYVYLPYLQAVQAGGMSIEQLRTELRQGYSEAMRNPVVSVTPMFRVIVTGEVQRPGIYVITPTHTLFDVIGMAGGFRSGADAEKLRVVRQGEVVQFDALRALERGEDLDGIRLRSGDQVVVPAARSRINFRSMLTVLQTVSLILVSYRRIVR